MFVAIHSTRIQTVISVVTSPFSLAIVLSVFAIIKGVRSGNPTRYFGNPIAVLPKNWQRWFFDERN
jgi:hypothetical protein